MGVEVDIFLFGKPEWEIGDLENVSPDEIRALGDEMKERLYNIATIMEKLTDAGWERYGASLYSISFYKDISEEEAVRELEQLGINVDDVNLMEVDEEEEEEEEEEDDDDDDIDDDILDDPVINAAIEEMFEHDENDSGERDESGNDGGKTLTRELMLWQIPMSKILMNKMNRTRDRYDDEEELC